MVKKALIVVGLGYGDEGKGITTDFLCQKHPNSIVIRFNGGHQAGHTVYTSKDTHHIFSSFGSGTLRKIPTYWSSYCTFSPIHFLDELHSLITEPKIYIDINCSITTHYDVLYNRTIESTRGFNRNGSCGVGFGATIDRQQSNISLLFSDLLGPVEVFKKKLAQIRAYYRLKINIETNYNFDNFNHNAQDKALLDAITEIGSLLGRIIYATEENEIFHNDQWDTVIFEGAQGILLDQNYGKSPNITKSNTTSRNALEMLNRLEITSGIEIYYVTRAYQTRHGAGAFHKKDSLILVNNETETNIYNPYQQDFKVAYLDLDLLNYALECDNKHSLGINKNLIVTCIDHLEKDVIQYYLEDELHYIKYNKLPPLLNCNFKEIFFSHSIYAENFILHQG